MPFSTDLYKAEVFEHMRSVLTSADRVLDVGPGVGKYGKGLSDFHVDAVEIYQPYIDNYGLKDIYKNVYCCDILNFDWSWYSYIIFGDVLEHIGLEDAQKLISSISENRIKCLVAVPYMYEQGEWKGNVYETHLQPDLTRENMLLRYPNLRLLIGAEGYGYYINY